MPSLMMPFFTPFSPPPTPLPLMPSARYGKPPRADAAMADATTASGASVEMQDIFATPFISPHTPFSFSLHFSCMIDGFSPPRDTQLYVIFSCRRCRRLMMRDAAFSAGLVSLSLLRYASH
jgi:hypothetical protein